MKFMMSSVLTPSPLDESCSFIVYKASRSCLWMLPPLDLLILHDHSQSLISDHRHRELLSNYPTSFIFIGLFLTRLQICWDVGWFIIHIYKPTISK